MTADEELLGLLGVSALTGFLVGLLVVASLGRRAAAPRAAAIAIGMLVGAAAVRPARTL